MEEGQKPDRQQATDSANYDYAENLKRTADRIIWTAATGNRKAKRELLTELEQQKAAGGLDVQYMVVINAGIDSLRDSLR